MYSLYYNNQSINLVWYSQDIINANTKEVYGSELLTRAFKVNNKEIIPTQDIINHLKGNIELFLDITGQQVIDMLIGNEHYNNVSKKVWINVSGKIVADNTLFKKLWDKYLSRLSENNIKKLVLEICEDEFLDKSIEENIRFLQSKGIKVAMDDFGSGHSNLLRLSRIDFDYIKLDLELIKNVPDNLWETSIYKEIISLCTSKGCLVVAEGIENQEQSEFTYWAGVNMQQGFLFSKPKTLIQQY
ncbi:EAL domain-containing protein [Vibrio zhugei]|uniref:EAL domain-containing protein n=2 Tax=Vibrio zhugei TaxID=2479546 RepID=A0ABV7CA33_9VIBR|nr:EAL domain-containing protein [Vibrio zhugei]